MNIVDQIILLECKHIGITGDKPKSIYLGSRQWYELMRSSEYQTYAKMPRQVAGYSQDTFREMNVYRLNTDDHIRIA